ncbi:MAG: NADH:flavin oxidoreductase/NADH oxidase [Planctomycetota bacterium]
MSVLFNPFRLRDVTLRNRIGVSPMCTYSAVDGRPNDWHLVHYGARATGGAGIVIAEATAIEPAGRISPHDCGLWDDGQVDAWRPISRFLSEHGAVPAVQIAHGGRKAGTAAPWDGGKPLEDHEGGWEPVAPSPEPFRGHRTPRVLTESDLAVLRETWVSAAERARAAGFEVLEIHMAHGYLLHEFLSPLVNRREDDYGGDLENRMRFPLEVVAAVRSVWPEEFPLFVRISATDWTDDGWSVEDSVILARRLEGLGVDLVDCSSGGAVSCAPVPASPNYQVPFAARLRREAGIATAAVGLIREPAQAEAVVAEGSADLVLLGREFLREPHWPLHAAHELGADASWPRQYLRGAPIC